LLEGNEFVVNLQRQQKRTIEYHGTARRSSGLSLRLWLLLRCPLLRWTLPLVPLLLLLHGCTQGESDLDEDTSKNRSSRGQIVALFDNFVDPESQRDSWSSVSDGKIVRHISPEFWREGFSASFFRTELHIAVPNGRTELKVPEEGYLMAEIDHPVPLSMVRGFDGVSIAESKNCDEILESLATAPLKAIYLKDETISAPGLRALGKMKLLEDLELLNVTFANLPSLRFLKLKSLDSRSVDEGANLLLLKASSLASSVLLKDGDLTSEMIDAICKMPNLTELSLNATNLSDEWLNRILLAKNLKKLEVHATQVTDDGLRNISRQTHLELLNVSRCPITTKGAAYIAGVPSLKNIDFCYTELSDDSIKKLQALKNIETMAFSNTNITAASFTYFAKIRSLKSLGLGDLKCSLEDLQKLKAQMKQCLIH